MSEVRRQTFHWHVPAVPAEVWPIVADTNRFNEAAGLPKHVVRDEPQPDGSVRFFSNAKMGPFELAWEELPVEWVRERWFRHERVFSRGPFQSLTATLEMRADGDEATKIDYTLEVEVANWRGRLLLALGFLSASGKGFEKLIDQVSAMVGGPRNRGVVLKPPKVDKDVQERARRIGEQIEASGNGHGLAGRLSDYVLTSQEVDLGRIRPKHLAALWEADPLETAELCLQATHDGLLDSKWEILCPRCRGGALAATSLDRLPTEAHCNSCNVSYDSDFSKNIELSFMPAATVRPISEGEFCLFGPMSTPHVLVQSTVRAGETRELPVSLPPGSYRYRTLETGGQLDIDHENEAQPLPEFHLLSEEIIAKPSTSSGALTLHNGTKRSRTLLIESREWVADALTAHEVTTLQAFRDLFATDSLKPGDEMAISQVALLFTDLSGSSALYEKIGDAAAYQLVHRHFAFLGDHVRRRRGAVIKTIGDAVMAAFAEPSDALQTALDIQADVADFNRTGSGEHIQIKLGVHAGGCIAVTLNGELDYFGTMVNLAARLQGEAGPGEIVVSKSLSEDPRVARVLTDKCSPLAPEEVSVKGFERAIPILRIPNS